MLAPSLLVFGALSDRLGRRPVIAAGLGVAIAGLGLFALARSTPWLFAARAVQGLAVGMISGAATAALVELEPGGRGRAAIVSTLAQAGGSAAGPLVAGMLAQWAPAPRVTAFVAGIAVTTLVLAGVLVVRGLPGPAAAGRWRLQRPGVPAEIRARFARVALTAAAAWAVAALYLSVVPSYAGSLLGTANLALEGAITAFMLLASCAAQVALRRAAAPERDQALGLALVAAGLGALVLAFPAHALALVLAAALLGGVGHGMAFLGAQRSLNAVAPPARRGEITAAFFTCIYLGVAVSAIGVGWLATQASLTTAVATFAAVIGTAALSIAAWNVAARRGAAAATRG